MWWKREVGDRGLCCHWPALQFLHLMYDDLVITLGMSDESAAGPYCG